MKRREFLKRAGVGSAALAGLPALETLLATPAWAGNGNGGHGFFFVVVSKSTTTTHLIAFSGCGRINGTGIRGGGSFAHFIPGATTPFEIVATGHWRATKLLSFGPLSPPYGTLVAGIARWEAEFHKVSPLPSAVLPATLEMVCNLSPPGPAGLSVPGKHEGVAVTAAGQTFVPQEPVAVGLTLFTTAFQDQGGGDEEDDEDEDEDDDD